MQINKYSLFSKFCTLRSYYTQILITNGCLFSVKSLELEFLYTFNGTTITTTLNCHQRDTKQKPKLTIKKKEENIRLLKIYP